METEKKELDEEAMVQKIQEILAQVNSCSNPDELESLKRLIKKNVPFTRRGYFSAMLLKALMEKPQRRERPARENRAERKSIPAERRQEKAVEGGQEAPQKTERALPEGAKTLYLNVGKMKHLYAKNLSILLQKELGITRDDIYSLRVHDKYSFITMSEENCDKAIEKINGMDINGRTAQINYSTK